MPLLTMRLMSVVPLGTVRLMSVGATVDNKADVIVLLGTVRLTS